MSEGALFGIGNPLLDISAEVSTDLLEKYKIKANDAILAEESHLPIYEELAALPNVEYIAGGATQNAIRIAQWMMQIPGASTYMGCVGQDEYADKMEAGSKADGVRVEYLRDPTTPTGKCAVIITGHNRSLVTDLKAANNYKLEHLTKPENFALVEKARFYYIAGFFMTVSPDSIMTIAKHACEHNKTFTMNLSAPFLMQVPPFKATLMNAMPYIDILFGNETEAATFAETEGWETRDVAEIAMRISKLPKENGARGRMVVFTQGTEPTIVASEGKIMQFPIKPLKAEEIVDTNAAGDAYVGGFLSQLVLGKSIAEAARAGAYSAHLVIQRSGCTFPPKPSFIWA
jgi:adenosine kinase